MSNVNQLDLDSLLDSTLDDLADAPSFKPFPAGTHRVSCSFDVKQIGDKAAFELTCTMLEPIELADPTQELPKAGDTASTAYFMGNDVGEGKFKVISKIFMEALNLENTKRAIIEGVKDVECVIISDVRTDKKDPTKQYFGIVELQVV